MSSVPFNSQNSAGMAARMVDLQSDDFRRRDPYSDTNARPQHAVIDDEILLAFERGAHLHVEKSLDAVKKDLEARADALMALIPQISAASALDDAVLRAAARVVSDTRFMLVIASRLQAELTDKVSSGDTTADAKRTFYRKNYARTRGIVTQVQEVADAIFLLSDSCAQATEGSDDVEKVRSHVGNLRGTIARLLTQAEVKMHSVLEQHARGDQLHEAAGNVKKSAHDLEARVRLGLSGWRHPWELGVMRSDGDSSSLSFCVTVQRLRRLGAGEGASGADAQQPFWIRPPRSTGQRGRQRGRHAGWSLWRWSCHVHSAAAHAAVGGEGGGAPVSRGEGKCIGGTHGRPPLFYEGGKIAETFSSISIL